VNVFELKDHIIDDYHRYVESFLNIRDERIAQFVNDQLSQGVLWPDPLVQLNPSYEMGQSIDALVDEGILHPLCQQIFQNKGTPFKLYHHQEQAIRIAAQKQPYVLTTGTGSGKSLTYLIPIIDHILKNDPGPEQVRALLIYPMNALINSQEKAIRELLGNLGEGNSRIRFGRYTGQEDATTRKALQDHPPHILLTNYMMLELMMSRPDERVFLDRAVANLEFLVLDELHTYTGRQGADVSMLVRRVRRRCGNDDLICIGTSATMVAGGTRDEQQAAVANVAGKIFGVDVSPDHVIDERLKRSIACDGDLSADTLKSRNQDEVPADYDAFVQHPLSAWIEETFGLQKEEGFFRRRTPITLSEGAGLLTEKTDADQAHCEQLIRAFLHQGSELRHADNTPVFAVRLHQFISQGDSVYGTLQPPEERHLTLSGQRYTAGGNGHPRLLAPLVFCRVCGQEYYQVLRREVDRALEPRLPREDVESDTEGYLLIDWTDDPIWSEERVEDLPEEWFRPTKSGRSLKREYRDYVPECLYVADDGTCSPIPHDGHTLGWFMPAPFLTCLCCGTVYDRRTNDFRKLARLSSEGRSTATTLLCISTVIQMQQDGTLEPEARKILSFTDNRQDASLQAGHFNDFVQIGLLRSAIFRALQDKGTLNHTNIASEVVNALSLPFEAFAQNPGTIGPVARRNREALVTYVEYRLYQDLRRGWRIVQPNLEQCGLLRIEYEALEDVCQEDAYWSGHPLFAEASPEHRFIVARAFLGHLRQSLALDALCLQGVRQETIKRQVNQTLKEPWIFDDDERMVEGCWFAWGERRPGEMSLSPVSVFGRYLRSTRAWPDRSDRLTPAEYEPVLRALVDVLDQGGYLSVEYDGDDFRLQLRADTLQWTPGDGTPPPPDPVRTRRMAAGREEEIPSEANRFFTHFYRQEAMHLGSLEGREHTGQTSREDREDREKRFRAGDLSTLFCSPTMELGIDIADLNAVNMRNVPPTPANYAQRSGRAGRSGQPAILTTYCSTGSGHDQYFFRRKQDMVAGVVVPPRLDLTNEDLITSHIHAVWLAEVGLPLGSSIADLVHLNEESLPLVPNITPQINLSENRIQNCLDNCRAILAQCPEVGLTEWYLEEWLEQAIRNAARAFDTAFDRWRELYNAAHRQLIDAQEALRSAHQNRLTQEQRREAERREREAQHQKDLLCNQVRNRDDSDFYPYRYLASEGFLPGYNFPRLPIRAYIPRSQNEGEYIVRPRFLALTEFGPRNVLYQEGRKYRIVRTLVPAGDIESRFTQAKLCKECGTFHAGESLHVDRCEQCATQLDADNSEYLVNLFEMTTASTQRIERITCDEEERVRQGYEITNHFRFSAEDGQTRKTIAEVGNGSGDALLTLTYGPAAELWNINRRWRRGAGAGFTLDTTLGIWNRKEGDLSDTALDAGEVEIRTGVQVFVRDTRNVLLIHTPETNPLNEEEMANLQHALQKGLCAVFQIDESEIASTRIGANGHRGILFWEAAEGGTGTLQRLIEEPEVVQRIASQALDICHFNPDSSEEIESPAIECARACYDCLMTYRNQWDHGLLDRYRIRDLLLQLSHSNTQRTYENRTYEQHYQWLRQRTDIRSQLEKDFLDELYRQRLKLPDQAQFDVPNYPARPDFYYEDDYICVFCDGSVHDQPQQKEQDERIRTDLTLKGYRMVVIRYDRPLNEQIAENAYVFGMSDAN